MDLFRKPPYNEKQTNPLTASSCFVSLRPLDTSNFTKDDVKAYFNNSYNLYETLFTSLKYDFVYYLCPDRLRLPLIFYYGHTAAVFVNKLCLAGLIKPKERINLEFETTFETGVDEMSWDDVEHYRMGGNYKWPSVEQTKQYRAKVRELINEVIDRTPLTLPVTWDSPWWALFMGFEHERIHYETSSVLIRQYPIDMVQRPTCWSYGPFRLGKSSAVAEAVSNPMVRVDATDVRVGKSVEFPSYGWDNEYGRVECRVSAFEASKFKVTNEQFLEFVLANGYGTRELWSDEGWEWAQYKQARHPLFWVCPMRCKSGCGGTLAAHSHCQEKLFANDELEFFKQTAAYSSDEEVNNNNNNNKAVIKGEGNKGSVPFKYRLMFDVVEMPRNWPVEVNYHEAQAYCKWRGDDFRLLTEAEHHAIRDRDVLDLNASSDVIYQKDAKVNHNMAFGSSTPVNMYPSNQKGFHDVFGNVWEWVEDHFNGLPGHRTHFLYDDFSTPCYDGRHNLIMGGSWASTGDECSHFARFMFRRHFYQHCGFRLARSLTNATPGGTIAESASPLSPSLRPNPQIRLVSDRVFVLGNGFPDNKPSLNESKLVLNYYPTANAQYLYDSCEHPEYLEAELARQFGEAESSQWYAPFASRTLELVRTLKINRDTATHLGCSTGRLAFDLARLFHDVVGVDFSGRFLDVAMRLQADGVIEAKIAAADDDGDGRDRTIRFDITENMSAGKVVFKQMTWIPNEIPKSDLVVLTMLDRVMKPQSWLRRMKEVVKPYGLLIVYSAEWNAEKLKQEIGQMFDLHKEVSTTDNGNVFTAWRMNETYALENL